ncbi:MAG TPA: DNA polymerase III subunit beta [Ignavibacteria bacterium]|nr:DNA polymerase III subunit beta [Bacteroidota bacterium]HRE12112.1 DNA polymerase III subunit beta [Ignavibacteria bacterium]HRF66594.1 DNA polymerase III subunit beta [Ignavibacteria bacterium]HRJ03677.1 DNA polymerase III subunit beta [Ignavibacteria bacterium]HRJ84784.1 DNA polymerase III subunit beta [Ignavibacteria bacterium]
MKFTVKSNDLISAISKVITVTPTRSTLPILSNLFFSLEGKELTIIGSDLEVYIEIKISVDGKSDGQVALPAKKLESLLSNLSGKELNFDLQNGFKTIIKTKGGKWTLTGEDPNDFPMPAEVEGSKEIDISGALITRYLPKAIHAASSDELRRSMNGVFFEIKKGEFKVVATDGHRLVKIINNNFDYSGDKTSMLVPIKTCQLMTRLFKSKAAGEQDPAAEGEDISESQKVSVFFSNEFLKCSFGNITIHSRLIDDTFPNYESVIPNDNEKILKVAKNDLIGAVKRSIILSDQVTNKTSFSISESELKVRAANNEYGTDADETIESSFTEADEFEIAFNGKYLLEALQHFDGDELLFDFSTPLKASIIRPAEQKENEDLMMLVMPVRNI